MKELLMQFIDKELAKKIPTYIYNEFSLQHELGIYLREQLGDAYRVTFERHIANVLGKEKDKVKTVKHEIDIVIEETATPKKYAIELKFPRNGQYPEQMLSFIKDIRFCEEMLDKEFQSAWCLTLVEDDKFYSGKYSTDHVYQYFRTESPGTPKLMKADAVKQPEKDEQKSDSDEKKTLPERTVKSVNDLRGEYHINWQPIPLSDKKYRYYLIEACR